MARKVDTFKRLEAKCLHEFVPVHMELFDKGSLPENIKQVNKAWDFIEPSIDPSKGMFIAVREDLPIGDASLNSFLECTFWLDKPGQLLKAILKAFKRGHTALVSESPRTGWITQGVIRLADGELLVELDGDPEKDRICKFYDISPFLVSYVGDWNYKGPHRSLINKLMNIICKHDLFGYFIEFTNFNTRGLIIWELRDRLKDTILFDGLNRYRFINNVEIIL